MRPDRSDTSVPSITNSASSWSRAALGLLLVATVGACKNEPKVEQEIARTVKVAVVAEGARGGTLTSSGTVRPRIESALGFRVPGKIVERTVNVGDRVEVDQVIAW